MEILSAAISNTIEARIDTPSPKKDVREQSLVSEVSGGDDYVQEKVIDVEDIVFDYGHMSSWCTFSLSVLPGLVFASAAPSEDVLKTWATEALKRCTTEEAKIWLASLERVYKSDTCCICLDDTPDVVLYQCGHQCCHRSCAEKLTTCPLCRAYITAKL